MERPARAAPVDAIGPVLAGFVLGTGLQLQQPVLWDGTVYAAISAGSLVLAAALAFFRNRALTVIAWAAVAAALGFALVGARALHFASDALSPALEGHDIRVTGVISGLPQRTEVGTRFRLRLESASEQGEAVRLPPQLALGWYGGVVASEGLAEVQPQPMELRAGDRWQITVRLKAPHGHLNPHGFDYELWLWEQGLQASGYVRSGQRDPTPRRLGATWQYPVEQARQSVREAIYAQVEDRRWAGVLAALVVGDQAAIEKADWDVFRATGVAHLMSISGLHVTMFAWAAAWAIGLAWRRSTRACLWLPSPTAALLGGVMLAGAYALFSGWGVPAQRTVCMLGTVALLRLGARHWPWPTVWLLACAAVVLLDPWALLQPGFWLSFVAVGVLFAAGAPPAPARGSDAGNRPGVFLRALGALRSMLREQWIVTVALTPLSLLLFGQVSVVGLLANLVAIPWVTLIVTPLGMGGVLVPVLWEAGAWALAALSWLLEWLATWPAATWSAPAAPIWLGIAAVAGGVVVALRLPWSLRLLGVPLVLPALLWQAPRPPAGEFEILAADIGQGNAVLVRTASHALLYDAGPAYSRESDAGQRVVVPLLRALGERLDTIVLSHRDSDHTGGAAAVLAMQPQAALLSSIETGHVLQQLRPARRCVAPLRWQWDGVQFELLHPVAEDYEGAPAPNAISCVLRIGNGRRHVLLAGDIERAQEEALVARGEQMQADVLLVPHHGSKTSSTDGLLAAVRPTFALVQAGYRNRFGHPAAPVVQRYAAAAIPVVDSPRCGAALWRSEAPGELVCERDRSRRYWHHRLPAPVGKPTQTP